MEEIMMNLAAFVFTTFVIIVFVMIPAIMFAAAAVVTILAYLPILAISSLIFVLPSTRTRRRHNEAWPGQAGTSAGAARGNVEN